MRLVRQKVAPAIMMGNSVIVLPSSDNPLTLMMLTEMLVEAGVPNGVVQCLTAPGSVKSAAVTDPRVHLVTLTGSTEVGIQTAKLAAANLTHTALELGGNDAFIVLEDGDVDLAVEEMIWGRMYNTGQVCCASKRFLIHNSLKDEFAEKAVARIKTLNYGDPLKEETQISCLISEAAAVKVEKQVAITTEQGGKIILGGKETVLTMILRSSQRFLRPRMSPLIWKSSVLSYRLSVLILTRKPLKSQINPSSVSQAAFSRKIPREPRRSPRQWKQAAQSSTEPASSGHSKCRSAAGSTAASVRKES